VLKPTARPRLRRSRVGSTRTARLASARTLSSSARWNASCPASARRSTRGSSRSVELGAHVQALKIAQKHYDELFPPPTPLAPDVLAQAALFVVLREHARAAEQAPAGPWAALAGRRFGGDVAARVFSFQLEPEPGADADASAAAESVDVHVVTHPDGTFSVSVRAPGGSVEFAHARATLRAPTRLVSTLGGHTREATLVVQPAAPGVPGGAERIHVFGAAGAHKVLRRPPPGWLAALGAEVRGATGALRAPMPSVVVDVKVAVGDKVEKGQAIVVLESMKTESVLRAPTSGVVRAVACAKGEMVEEGRELVDIEPEDADADGKVS
jgi:3-methylcrotonyl-CoA carboxylase alpha subunit